MKTAVVGGGLAGLAAALELVDAGAEVTLHEARPTLGGAVQTLPEREGDPEPPPDNGQHIALGCFTEYLRFLTGSAKAAPICAPGSRCRWSRRTEASRRSRRASCRFFVTGISRGGTACASRS